MTYRERLADLICGGALTRARDKLADAAGVIRHAARVAERAEDRASEYLAWGNERHADWLKAHAALRAIIAQERPTSNATVKRCARIAREALGE